jgi:hypothetical protein
MKNLIMILCLVFVAYSASAKDFSISHAAQLSGCWQGTEADVTEQWMAPAGGMMLGMSRTVENGIASQYEFLRIAEEKGSVAYIAKPFGQAEASFKLVKANPDQLVFENPDHDFPQRILYSFAANALTARIEGKKEGKELGFDFPMRRVACP